MKKFIYSKPVLIISSSILLTLIIIIYTKSKANYHMAIMGSFNSSEKYVVMLDIKKKAIINTGIKLNLDKNDYGPAVSADKKYLAYIIFLDGNASNILIIKNLQNGTENKIPSHNKSSNIMDVKWIDKKTLLYYENNTLYTLDVNTLKPKAVKIADSSVHSKAIYYPENHGFIICTYKVEVTQEPGTSQFILNSAVPAKKYESSLYLMDSEGSNKKLLKKFENYFIINMRVVPDSDNILITADKYTSEENYPAPCIYVYNIKSRSFKLVLKGQQGTEDIENIFPYDNNHFLFQTQYKLYNVNIKTGEMKEFTFTNGNPDAVFSSFTGEE